MEEEIDLTLYIEAISQNWYWVIGSVFLAAILAYSVLSWLPSDYEATATVIVLEPKNIINFDERLKTNENLQSLDALAQLAKNNTILSELLAESPTSQISNISDLKDVLDVKTGSNQSIIELTSTLQDPVEAAQLANMWADVYVNWANKIYSHNGSEQVVFFEDQLSMAQDSLAINEQALINYQEINRSGIISNTLSAYNNNYLNYLDERQQSVNLIQDINSLREYLLSQSNTSEITLADQLIVLTLQLEAFDANPQPSFQLQLEADSNIVVNDQEALLKQLDKLLEMQEGKISQIDIELSELDLKILELQQELNEAETEYNRILLNKIEAEETFTALTRKVAEERISYADTTDGIQIASLAIVPEKPVSKNKILTSILSALIVGIISVGVIIIVTWIKKSKIVDS